MAEPAEETLLIRQLTADSVTLEINGERSKEEKKGGGKGESKEGKEGREGGKEELGTVKER